jgi:predicted AAA+ superfamily ATPase
MNKRTIYSRLLEALSDTPVVFLRGARQTGKTTLVKQLAEASARVKSAASTSVLTPRPHWPEPWTIRAGFYRG